MFTRRFYRIKAFQQLYAYVQEEQPNLSSHEKAMLKAIGKTHELYIYLLHLLPEFRHFISTELELQKSKYIPSETNISQLEKLYKNKLLSGLENADALSAFAKHYKIHWNANHDVFKQLWQITRNFEPFEKYAAIENPGFSDDKKFIIEWLQLIIIESELLNSYIEERYISWEDDQTLVLSTLMKSIDKMKELDPGKAIMLENDDDQKEARQFMVDLFRKTITENQQLEDLLADKVKNWDVDRIAVSDMLLMKMALCEILYFTSVPVKVSINEYLEMAKLYSTPQSHGFINGILDKVQLDLRKQNKIQKAGRGLVE